MKAGKDSIYCKYIKRVVDIVCSLLGLILLSPLMAIVAVVIRWKMGSPVLFSQERIGKGEKAFPMKKFRSMTDECDANGELLPTELRTTKLGVFLRASSIDELPALLSILKGDMSIVGPRPLPVFYIPYYTETERRRHDIRPGLSGLAQVSGRNMLRWEEKFAYDLEYVNNCSFWLDVKIICKTMIKVIARQDVVSSDTVKLGDHVSRPLHIEREGRTYE